MQNHIKGIKGSHEGAKDVQFAFGWWCRGEKVVLHNESVSYQITQGTTEGFMIQLTGLRSSQSIRSPKTHIRAGKMVRNIMKVESVGFANKLKIDVGLTEVKKYHGF